MARTKYTVTFPAAKAGDVVTWPNSVQVYADANIDHPLGNGYIEVAGGSFTGWSTASSVTFTRAGTSDAVTVTAGSPTGTGAAATPSSPGTSSNGGSSTNFADFVTDSASIQAPSGTVAPVFTEIRPQGDATAVPAWAHLSNGNIALDPGWYHMWIRCLVSTEFAQLIVGSELFQEIVVPVSGAASADVFVYDGDGTVELPISAFPSTSGIVDGAMRVIVGRVG